MAAGSHKATVVIDGKADGLNSAAKASAKSIGRLEDSVARLEQQMRKATGQIEKQAETTRKLEERIKKLRNAQGKGVDQLKQAGMQLQGWISTAQQAIAVVDQLATRQLNLTNVQDNLPFSIDKARTATRGLISDYDLMQQAVTANRLGVAKSETEFANLARTSTKLGVSMGKDATRSLEDFTNGLGRGSTEVLDNLGIILRAEEAHKLYAASVGTTAAKLTEAEKRQAVINLGLQRGAAAADKAKISVDGLGGAWARATIRAENLLDVILQIDTNFEELSVEVFKEFGLNQEQATEATDEFTDALVDVGLHVSTLGLSTLYGEISDAADEYAESNDKITRSIKRGIPSYGAINVFLDSSGTKAERAAKAFDFLARSFTAATNAERELAKEAEKAAIFESQSKTRVLDRQARIADRKDAQETETAEATIAMARLQRRLAEARSRKAGTGEILGLIHEVETAETESALRQEGRANSQADRLGATEKLEAALHSADLARGSAREAQRQAQQKAALRRHATTEAEASLEIERANRRLEQARAEGAGAAEEIARINDVEAAELGLEELQSQHAKNRGERLQVVGSIEATEHTAELARNDVRRAQVEELEAFAVSISERQLERLEQAREIAAVEAKIEASKALRGAEGIEDPLERLERETSIRLELIDVQLQAANDVPQQMQLADQREAVLHDAKIARLAEERDARKKTHNTIVGITNKSAELQISAGQSLIQKVAFEKRSLSESVKNVAATEGAKQAIIGASEAIRAVVAIASFNYPKAAAHAANAGVAFAFAATMAATYGVATGIQGRTASPAGGGAGFNGQGFGSAGGSAANGPGGSSSSAPAGNSSPDIPNSPSPQTAAGTGAAAAQAGPTIIIQGDVIGTPKREFFREVDKGLRDLSFEGRRVSNG